MCKKKKAQTQKIVYDFKKEKSFDKIFSKKMCFPSQPKIYNFLYKIVKNRGNIFYKTFYVKFFFFFCMNYLNLLFFKKKKKKRGSWMSRKPCDREN
jgi:hypothetical protein